MSNSFHTENVFSGYSSNLLSLLNPQIPDGLWQFDCDKKSDAKPTFKATAERGKVTFDWVKGEFDGVVIEGQSDRETTYTFLDKDFKSPFVDMRPNLAAGQPEKRRYRMIYLLDDEVGGVWSDEVVVTTMA